MNKRPNTSKNGTKLAKLLKSCKSNYYTSQSMSQEGQPNKRFLKPYGTQNTIPTALQPSPFLQSPISPATHQNSTPHTDYNMINPNRTVIINHRHHISCPHYITPAASSCSTTTSTKTNPTCT